jgi:hypothetical protein
VPAPPSRAALTLARELLEAGLRPPTDRQLGPRAGLLPALEVHGIAVRLAHGRHAHADAVTQARQLAVELAGVDGSLELPAFRDAIGGSRSDAKAFLDHLDDTGFTRRRRDGTRAVRQPVRRGDSLPHVAVDDQRC